jgi:uncharacterized protein YkwD
VRIAPIAGLLALAALVACGALLHAPRAGQASSLDPEEQAFVNRVNQWRAANGAPPLSVNAQMSAAAQWMAEDNAARNLLTTVDSLGRDPDERLADYGVYPSSRSEFDAYGYESGAHLADSYFPSGYGDRLCDPKFTAIGVGRTFQDPSLGDLNWTWVIDLAKFPGDPMTGPGNSCPNEPGPVPSPTTPATPSPSPAPTLTPTPAPTPTPTPAPTPTPEPTPEPTPSPEPTPGPTTPGDADCDGAITSVDALNVLRDAAGLGAAGCIPAGNVDCDGDRDSVDALHILRYVASLPLSLPPGCPAIGT